jgi:hypothetical protein
MTSRSTSVRLCSMSGLIVIALAAAGCGGSGTNGGAGSAPAMPQAESGQSTGSAAGTTACSVVTEDDAAKALGADPGPGEAASHVGASSCAYGAAPSLVTVDLVPSGGRSAYDHARGLAAPGQLVDIGGVGEGAFGVSKGPLSSIEFYKGDALVTVVVMIGNGGTSSQDHAVALAKVAAGRL